jgi:hypothetical protein
MDNEKSRYKELAKLLNHMGVSVSWESEYLVFTDDEDSDYYVSVDEDDKWRLYKADNGG